MPEKMSITIQVSSEDYAKVQKAADAEHISMMQWLQKTLFEATTKPAEIPPATIPTPDVGDKEVTLPPNKPQPQVMLHSCHHNHAATPAFFSVGQSEGICRHQDQYGRVCFWASQVANQCPKYSARRVMVPPPGEKR